MNAPMSQVKIERFPAHNGNIQIRATIVRYGQKERQYTISEASARRLGYAIHGKYTCKWGLSRRTGWYANMYISNEQIRNYYLGMSQWGLK